MRPAYEVRREIIISGRFSDHPGRGIPQSLVPCPDRVCVWGGRGTHWSSHVTGPVQSPVPGPVYGHTPDRTGGYPLWTGERVMLRDTFTLTKGEGEFDLVLTIIKFQNLIRILQAGVTCPGCRVHLP